MPFVVSISAVSGGGKTAVSNTLAQRWPNSTVIHFDDYTGDLLGMDYCDWSEAGADANEWNLSALISDVYERISRGFDYVIIDYPFGRAHKMVASLVDCAVFIDTPLDIALARRVLRDYCFRNHERKTLHDPLGHLAGIMRFYLDRHRATYLQHVLTVKETCDVILNGENSVDMLTNDILQCVSAKQHHETLK